MREDIAELDFFDVPFQMIHDLRHGRHPAARGRRAEPRGRIVTGHFSRRINAKKAALDRLDESGKSISLKISK